MRIERAYGDTGLEPALGVLDSESRLLVVGPVGAGRTTLLAALARHEGQYRRVWWCRGHKAGPPSGEPEIVEGTVAVLLAAAASEPTTLLIDDADQLDDAVVERLHLLVERRAELHLRVVAAHRAGSTSAAVGAMACALLGRHGAVHLGPLTAEGVAAWIAAEHDSGTAAAEVFERTEGWPDLVATTLSTGSVADLVQVRLATLAAEHRRVLRAVSFGVPVGTAALTAATAVEAAEIDRAVEAATTAGLLHDGVAPVEAVAEEICLQSPAAERSAVAVAAASAPTDVVLAVATRLLSVDDRSSEAGMLYERAADLLATTDPSGSADLYRAAIRAGRPDGELQVRRVAVELAAGRMEEAVRLANHADSTGSSAMVAQLRRATGAGWAHLGRSDLAAECYLGAGDPILAALPLLATGRVAEAREAVSMSSSPAASSARLLAEGALAWATGDTTGALELLARSARLTEVVGGAEDWPDSPHALGAVALAWLDAGRADRLIHSALERSVGGGAFATRHRLLEAWTASQAGRIDTARAVLDTAAVPSGRDAVLAAAIRAAVAVRTADPAELPAVHRKAADAYWGCMPDAFAAGFTVELAHLAARVGGDPQPLLRPLEALSSALGDPPGIAVCLHWARLLVAVAADDRGAARCTADALTALAGAQSVAADPDVSGPTRVLADAAVAFADVLCDKVDPDIVRSVAARLVERGLVFEASRLVGAASLRCDDAAEARALLADLRRLRVTQVRDTAARPRAIADLSDREREVARGVLEGRTHREIGAQLYISAKTVEHHVARIRQKLGAGSRAELLAAIREQFDVAP